jgi:hypothetical protein
LVTLVRSIENAATSTRCCGRSSSGPSWLPIENGPAGTRAMSIASFAWVAGTIVTQGKKRAPSKHTIARVQFAAIKLAWISPDPTQWQKYWQVLSYITPPLFMKLDIITLDLAVRLRTTCGNLVATLHEAPAERVRKCVMALRIGE